MVPVIRAEALSRFTAINAFVRALRAQEAAAGIGDVATRAGKGLVFVQNYAVYEYVVVRAVRALIAEANRLALPLSSVRVELLSLALNAEFDRVTTGSIKKTWEHRVAVLRRTRSRDALTIQESLFPKDGSHFRPKQLDTIWELFGLPPPTLPQARLIGLVEEMVEHRNHIAHGQDAPEDVGRRFTISDIEDRVLAIEAACTHILTATAAYLASASPFR